MLPVLASDPRSGGLTDLTIIGVPDDLLNKPPSVSSYPRKFSADALPVWTDLIKDPDWKAKCRMWGSLNLVWHNTVMEFLNRARQQGILPFLNNTDTAKNDYVKDFITRGRLHLVQYVNETGVFKRVTIRKAYREYRRRENGLTIRSWAELFPVQDPTFREWITEAPLPRFHKTTDNTYYRIVRPHVRMWVKFINRNRTVIGFEIDVAGTINIPGDRTPTRKEVDSYMDATVFLPILRAHRFRDVKTRLF